jgi:uncharacterized protein YjiS (DUF1127 family)
MKHRLVATPEVNATSTLPRVVSSSLSPMETALAWLGAAWTTYRRHTRGLRDLQAMNDRNLRDLGLTRHDVRAIIGGHYRKR